MVDWETVIGLEVHIQLATKSKMFSGAATAYGAAPNTQACAVDLALPGTLPVTNGEAISMAIKFGLAINANINHINQFVRKNYFYPDLSKGYQISQLEFPTVETGELKITTSAGDKIIGVTRAHLEEDAGKSLHEDFHGMSGIDYNRAGTPLMEIVSEPDLRSAEEVVAYLKAVNILVRYLGISDGDMSQGSMRCDVNVSMRHKGAAEFGTRAEVKNVNSYRFVEKAIHYEVARQIALLEDGKEVVQETRLYDSEKDETRSMRSKEEAHDYRYFPDPDLLPVDISPELVEQIRSDMVELPQAKQERFVKEYGLTDYDAELLATQKELADYYEVVQSQCKNSKLASGWVTSELLGALNKQNLNIVESPLKAEKLGALLSRIEDGTISSKIAKDIFQQLWEDSSIEVDELISKKGLTQITDEGELEKIITEIVANNPQQAEQYRGGRDKLMGYFVGQAMKQTQGRGDPSIINRLLLKALSGKE